MFTKRGVTVFSTQYASFPNQQCRRIRSQPLQHGLTMARLQLCPALTKQSHTHVLDQHASFSRRCTPRGPRWSRRSRRRAVPALSHRSPLRAHRWLYAVPPCAAKFFTLTLRKIGKEKTSHLPLLNTSFSSPHTICLLPRRSSPRSPPS